MKDVEGKDKDMLEDSLAGISTHNKYSITHKPAIVLLGAYLNELKVYVHKKRKRKIRKSVH